MLLDPFEKQLDLPPASIQLGDGDRRQREVVGQEYQALAGYRVFEADATQWRVEDLTRITTLGVEVGFGACHKEAAGFVQAMQPFEIDVASVHDVEGARLGQQQ